MTEFPLEDEAAGSALPESAIVDPGRLEAEGARDDKRRSMLLWPLAACVLAWLVPGAGHLLVGQRRRALLFGLLIATLFFGGLALDGAVYRPVAGDPLSYLAALGASGVGSLYMAVHAFGLGAGEVSAPYHEYGNTFTLVAGLLNLLVVLDAFDFAVLRVRRVRSEAAAPGDLA